jgi:hypothetical protein
MRSVGRYKNSPAFPEIKESRCVDILTRCWSDSFYVRIHERTRAGITSTPEDPAPRPSIVADPQRPRAAAGRGA